MAVPATKAPLPVLRLSTAQPLEPSAEMSAAVTGIGLTGAA